MEHKIIKYKLTKKGKAVDVVTKNVGKTSVAESGILVEKPDTFPVVVSKREFVTDLELIDSLVDLIQYVQDKKKEKVTH